MEFLTIWDLLISPFYLVVLTAIARRNRDKKYPIGHPLRAYYLPGLYVKFAGAIFIGLVYAYYYKGGDTFNYFTHARILNSSLNESITTWAKLMVHAPVSSDPKLYEYTSQMEWYGEPSVYAIVRITAFFGLFSGTTYIPIALLFAYFSFSGVWAMFRTFIGYYPHLVKQLAIAFLFIPSVVLWGSSIFKDTVCIWALGWLIYSVFRLFVNKDFHIKNLLFLIVSFTAIATIKIYILLAFIPALVLWLLQTYSSRIKSFTLRWVVNLGFVALTGFGFIFFTGQFAEQLNKYSLDKLAKTAETTRGWISYVSELEGGSSYSLGEFEPTSQGLLSKLPQAVNVTLFRPYLWEARKIFVIFSALEAFAFLVLTLMVLYRHKLKAFSRIARDPNLLFFIIFTIIFAFAVGVSSYNFGALSRYKIPCLPFFSATLLILLNHNKIPPTQISKPKSVVLHA